MEGETETIGLFLYLSLYIFSVVCQTFYTCICIFREFWGDGKFPSSQWHQMFGKNEGFLRVITRTMLNGCSQPNPVCCIDFLVLQLWHVQNKVCILLLFLNKQKTTNILTAWYCMSCHRILHGSLNTFIFKMMENVFIYMCLKHCTQEALFHSRSI